VSTYIKSCLEWAVYWLDDLRGDQDAELVLSYAVDCAVGE
jgi:hypothetical protein